VRNSSGAGKIDFFEPTRQLSASSKTLEHTFSQIRILSEEQIGLLDAPHSEYYRIAASLNG
jgi:hypothetical protein